MHLTEETAIHVQAKQDSITHMATGLAVVRNDKILLVRRTAHDFLGGMYELPGGGVDVGETITEGAVRELQEETGLTITNILGTFKGFDYATDRKAKVRQINFLVEVESGEITLDPREHDALMWVSEAELSKLTVSPEIRACLVAAFQLVRQRIV